MKNYLIFFVLIALISCSKEKPVQKETQLDQSRNCDPKSLISNDFLMDDQHSYLGFKIKYFGYSPVRGRFNQFDGTLFYSETNPACISATVFVDVSSINTGNERRDDDLKREDTWFDLDSFPFMQFVSTEVHPKENGAFDMIGELRIKGISRMDTISFEKPTSMSKDWAANDQVDFTGKMTINRQDFDVFGGDFWSSVMENGLTQLSDEVEIEIDMHCRRPDYQARFDAEDSSETNKKILLLIKDNGIEAGLKEIDKMFGAEAIRSGNLSSIGYTLNSWERHEEALLVFAKKQELFPSLGSTWNQIGITYLQQENYAKAKECFIKALEIRPQDSRANEYLRLIKRIDSQIRNG